MKFIVSRQIQYKLSKMKCNTISINRSVVFMTSMFNSPIYTSGEGDSAERFLLPHVPFGLLKHRTSGVVLPDRMPDMYMLNWLCAATSVAQSDMAAHSSLKQSMFRVRHIHSGCCLPFCHVYSVQIWGNTSVSVLGTIFRFKPIYFLFWKMWWLIELLFM